MSPTIIPTKVNGTPPRKDPVVSTLDQSLEMLETVPRYLEQRFPDRKLHIARLECANTDFRDLCRDYEDCVQVLDDLSRNPIPDLKRIKEYQELKLALELEVLEYLERPT